MLKLLRDRYQRSKYAQVILLALLAVVSLYLNASLVTTVKKASLKAASSRQYHRKVLPEDSYSYIGEDHPNMLPVERRAVKMLVEDSVRYSLTDPEAEEEWLWTGPIGDHDIRLGQDQRAFAVAMFHELHCLRVMRRSLESGSYRRLHPVQQGHIHHCFNYLRQWTLCSADVTLEPGDFAQRNFTTERTGGVHTCHDWEPVYDMVNAGWDKWEEYRLARGVPDQPS